jgi:Ca-activated chloride channel family protein
MNLLSDFHFIRPEWLFALIPLLLLIVAVRYLHKQQSGWQSVLASHLYQHLITTKGATKYRPPLFLLAFGWLVTVLAIAGPTWERLPQPVYQLHSGKVVVLDMSMSMRATDVTPDRLSRAKYKAIDLINAIGEGETGLVAYAGDAYTISPLSTDVQNLIALIPSLSPEIMPVQGSEPIIGLEAAVQLLESSGYQQGQIYWITDGIENNQMTEVASYIQSLPYRLSILAVGSEDGAPIKLLNGELLKDGSGAIVIPRLSPANLKSLANKGKGRYAPLQGDNSDIDYLSSQNVMNRETQKNEDEQEDKFGDEWKEAGPYLVLLLLPLAAYGFRRGLLSIMLLGLMLPGISPKAQASWWQDMWETGDQQGAQAFNNKDYSSAAEHFQDPLWKGSALYKNGDFEAALEAFRDNDSVEALYNQGNALAQLGEIEQAIAAYNKVLQQQSDHQDAIANKALLEQQQQDQQQQNQDQKDQQDQQDKDEQSQQDEQNQQQNQQNENGEEGTGEGSQQQNNEQDQQDQQSKDQQEEEKQQDGEEQQGDKPDDAKDPQEGKDQQAKLAEQELSEEEKEQMQRMQNLLRKVPDDPAFLLKRKMQLENQQRRRQQAPTTSQRNW